jgi:hypothetical protein
LTQNTPVSMELRLAVLREWIPVENATGF